MHYSFKIGLLLFILGIIASPSSYAQGEIDDEAKVFFRNERTFAGTLSTNGWHIGMQYAIRKDAFRSYILGGDIGSLRHPKEFKSQSPYAGGWGTGFVFGKTNEVVSIRFGAGFQKEIFGKYDKGGISVRYFYSAGLSLALMKPVYYDKVVGFDYERLKILTEESLFDPDVMQSIYDIYDRKSFFKGIDEIKPDPGIFARAGISFEYSIQDRIVNALEGGVQVEGFLNKIPIMASNDNRQLFLSLFVTYRFGKVLDARFSNSPI
jgi:hypothetical protein